MGSAQGAAGAGQQHSIGPSRARRQTTKNLQSACCLSLECRQHLRLTTYRPPAQKQPQRMK